LAGNDGFRTNFGVLNLSDVPLTLDYTLYAADGATLGWGTLAAAAHGYRQNNQIFADVTDMVVRGGYLVFSTSDASARFAAFGSVVDDGSHDPTLVLPEAVAGSSAMELIVPVVASNAGAAGTMWRSDVSVVNVGDVPTQVELVFHQDGSTQLHTLGLGAGRAHLFEDIVRQVFSATGSGWLELSGADPHVFVFSRTFNDDESGTYGQNIPAVASSGLTRSDETVVLAGLSSANGFRTNLGITSLAAVETTVDVRVYDDRGMLLGELPVRVGPGRFLQIQRLLSDELDYVGTAWAVLSSADADAEFIAHASVVDGGSGDPVYLPATTRQLGPNMP
jgi:hypothetical protein